jgi:hypothetical protein
MRAKTLVVLFIILGLLAGVSALVIRLKAPTGAGGVLGTYLLKGLPVNEIASISIESPEKSVSLATVSGRWVVKDRFDYPADFSKIADFVRKLKNAKIGRRFESSKDTLKRLSLKSPEDRGAAETEKGSQIQMQDKSGKLLAHVLLGKIRRSGGERSFPDGQYVRLGNDPTIYLIDIHFAHLQKDPSDWLEKTPVKVEANEVKKISCLSADGKTIRFRFERPEKGKDLEPEALPAHQKVDTSALNRLARALSSLGIKDVTDPSDDSASTELKRSNRLEYHMFNGMTYRVYPGKSCSESDRCYLKLEVDYKRPAPEEKTAAEDKELKKEEPPAEKTPGERSIETKKINDRLTPWVYVINKSQHDAFVTDLAHLLEKPDKTPPKKSG